MYSSAILTLLDTRWLQNSCPPSANNISFAFHHNHEFFEKDSGISGVVPIFAHPDLSAAYRSNGTRDYMWLTPNLLLTPTLRHFEWAWSFLGLQLLSIKSVFSVQKRDGSTSNGNILYIACDRRSCDLYFHI